MLKTGDEARSQQEAQFKTQEFFEALGHTMRRTGFLSYQCDKGVSAQRAHFVDRLEKMHVLMQLELAPTPFDRDSADTLSVANIYKDCSCCVKWHFVQAQLQHTY